jgi:hypothetical protein
MSTALKFLNVQLIQAYSAAGAASCQSSPVKLVEQLHRLLGQQQPVLQQQLYKLQLPHLTTRRVTQDLKGDMTEPGVQESTVESKQTA